MPKIKRNKTKPADIPYPQNTPLVGGAIFVVLRTLDELDEFWANNRLKLPYAAEDGHLINGEFYLRKHEWIFAPTVSALVKAVNHWDEFGIKPKWYDWQKEEPEQAKWHLKDFENNREYEIKNGTWTEENERNYPALRESFMGWWILENLPTEHQGYTDEQIFDAWMGEFSDSTSDRQLTPEAVEEFMQTEFFKSWGVENGSDSDVIFYNRDEMDKNVQYWKIEKQNNREHYGDESEIAA